MPGSLVQRTPAQKASAASRSRTTQATWEIALTGLNIGSPVDDRAHQVRHQPVQPDEGAVVGREGDELPVAFDAGKNRTGGLGGRELRERQLLDGPLVVVAGQGLAAGED